MIERRYFFKEKSANQEKKTINTVFEDGSSFEEMTKFSDGKGSAKN